MGSPGSRPKPRGIKYPDPRQEAKLIEQDREAQELAAKRERTRARLGADISQRITEAGGNPPQPETELPQESAAEVAARLDNARKGALVTQVDQGERRRFASYPWAVATLLTFALGIGVVMLIGVLISGSDGDSEQINSRLKLFVSWCLMIGGGLAGLGAIAGAAVHVSRGEASRWERVVEGISKIAVVLGLSAAFIPALIEYIGRGVLDTNGTAAYGLILAVAALVLLGSAALVWSHGIAKLWGKIRSWRKKE